MNLLTPEIWYAALASQHGVVVLTDDPVLAKQKLYAMRKALNDPDLEGLSIMTSPNSPNELWFVKRRQ